MTLHNTSVTKEIVFLFDLKEVRIYNPDGHYWPFTIDPSLIEGFKIFLDKQYDPSEHYFEDGTPVEIYENPEGTYVNDLDTRTNN